MVDSEEAGQWAGRVTLGPWQQVVTTWTILITFTQPLDWLDRWPQYCPPIGQLALIPASYWLQCDGRGVGWRGLLEPGQQGLGQQPARRGHHRHQVHRGILGGQGGNCVTLHHFYFYIIPLHCPARGGDRDLRDLRVRG